MRQSPLNNASFRQMFFAQVVALLGTGLSTVALSLLAYDLGGANAAVILGITLALKMTAYIIFSPVFGGFSHRFKRKSFLVVMDIFRAIIILLVPFVSKIWEIYLLIFLLNFFSAGFKPVFMATIPDILSDEEQYIKALSYSRFAYDMENILSPALAGIALLFFSYNGLFIINSLSFLASALFIAFSCLPEQKKVLRQNVVDEISFGIRSYLKTPRLQALLTLYLAVAAASAMIVVNTVVYIREYLDGSEADVALMLAASGGGSMIVAMLLPKLQTYISNKKIMFLGVIVMATGVGLITIHPSLYTALFIWFLVGVGLSMVQTPSGVIVNRSASAVDRSAYFSAQFALSHLCWLIFYLVAGYAGAYIGIEHTALMLSIFMFVFLAVSIYLWPSNDERVLTHSHPEIFHEHKHYHDEHHDHFHNDWDGVESHSHPHYHAKKIHRHEFFIDINHDAWPR